MVMSTEDDGLSVFLDGARPESSGQPSVFSQVDQEELIGRIGTVDDDMSSPFFAETLPEAEDAATQVFDIGIRLLSEGAAGVTDEPARSSGMRSSSSTRGVQGRKASIVTATPIAVPGVLTRDNNARRAFVLGGPDALKGF